MEPKRRHCIGDCNFTAYYDDQIGNGVYFRGKQFQRGYGISDIVFYRGRLYQRGYGFGSVFRKIGIPMLKFLGRHMLPAGVAIGSDLMNKRPLKESLRERGATFVRSAGRDGADKLASYIAQSGGGKRKRVYKPKKKTPKRAKRVKKKRAVRSRDIFNGLSA